MRDGGIHRIESAEANEILTPHGQAGRGKRGHVAQRLRQIEMLRRIRGALMKRGADQSTNTHDKSGVLDFPGLIQ